MLDKRRVLIVTLFIILVVIVIGTFLVINNVEIKVENEISEYTPAQEITDEQLRQTMITLYFRNEEQLVQETRTIDVKELINDPYSVLINMLIKGPKSEELKKTIPEETKLNKVERIGEKLVIDFSEEFIKNYEGNEKDQKLTIESIVKTLTELTEVNSIKININGEENKGFKDSDIEFDKAFTRDSI